MLKRVSEALNKNVEYVKEMHTQYFIFDDIQYLLKDEDNKEYLLVLCFDDNERQQPGEIWSKKVDRLMYRLYEYPIINGHKVKNKVLKYNITYEEIEKSNYRDEFSLNRFEVIYPNNKNYVLRYNDEALMLSIDGFKAKVGTWNNFTKRTTFLAMVNYVFKTFKNVKVIEYENLIYNCQFDNHYWRHPDFYLPLPTTVEELKSNLSSKSRHNLKRERRIITDEFGSLDLVDIKYEEVDQNIVNLFYTYKNITHDITDGYDITKRNLTDVYLLKCGNDTKGVLLSCEQSNIVFIENHTFDSSLRQYSFGQVMYDMYLDVLVEKGKMGLSLAGGNLEYKKRYGSICYNTYSGEIKKKLFKTYKLLQSANYNVDNWFFHKLSTLCRLIHK